MITNEQRVTKLAQCDEQVVSLYSSLETARTLKMVLDKNNVLPQTRGGVVDTVGDCMLGFFPKNELPKKITDYTDIPEETAGKIAEELRELLKSIPDKPTLPEADSSLRERLHLRPEQQEHTQQGGAGPSSEGGVKPLTKEELMSSLSPKRTMQADIAAIQKRGTGGTEKSTPVPNYAKPFSGTPEQQDTGVENAPQQDRNPHQ